jgi:hypothetical protein
VDPRVAEDIRDEDRNEILAMGLSVEGAPLKNAVLSEEFFTTYCGPKPVAVWGYRRKTYLGGTAEVWLFSARAVEDCRVAFAKESRRIVAMLLEKFEVLEVLVHRDYRRAFNWLGWLGFVPEDSLGDFHIMRCYRGMN